MTRTRKGPLNLEQQWLPSHVYVVLSDEWHVFFFVLPLFIIIHTIVHLSTIIWNIILYFFKQYRDGQQGETLISLGSRRDTRCP